MDTAIPSVCYWRSGIVGCAGLLPTVAAIEAKKEICLANKETLIAAGPVIVPLLRKHGESFGRTIHLVSTLLPMLSILRDSLLIAMVLRGLTHPTGLRIDYRRQHLTCGFRALCTLPMHTGYP